MMKNGNGKYVWFGIMLSLIIVFSLIGCNLFEHEPDRTPTTPNAQINLEQSELPGAAKNVTQKSRSPKTETIVIAAVGDSITHGQGSNRGGYVPALERKLRDAGYDVEVRKEAVPGERASSTVKRFDRAIAGADIVLIMIGTNDLVNTYTCPAPGFCNAVFHVDSMVSKALRAGIRPFVSMIPPIRTSCEGFWSNYNARRLNAQYVAVSENRHVPLVDNYYPILRSGGDSLFVDCLHFNDWGYDVIADRFFQALMTHNAFR